MQFRDNLANLHILLEHDGKFLSCNKQQNNFNYLITLNFSDEKQYFWLFGFNKID